MNNIEAGKKFEKFLKRWTVGMCVWIILVVGFLIYALIDWIINYDN